MIISKDSVVTIEYDVSSEDGQVIDSSKESGPLPYLHGHHNIIPGLEEALEGKTQGDSVKVTVSPEKAYGVYNEALVQTVDKNTFEDPSDIAEGMQFTAETPEGMMMFTVTKVDGNNITVDGNHPLAGMTLSFNATIKEIREASKEELEHGHVHVPGHHHHH